VAVGQRLVPLWPAPVELRPPDGQASVDLRRFRRDHGRCAPALGRRRELFARCRRVERGVLLLRARRDRRDVCRSGAGARDRVVPARVLHQLRSRFATRRSGACGVRGAGAGGTDEGQRRQVRN
jgi:hypothetical protein